jgi:hypothetical protein
MKSISGPKLQNLFAVQSNQAEEPGTISVKKAETILSVFFIS